MSKLTLEYESAVEEACALEQQLAREQAVAAGWRARIEQMEEQQKQQREQCDRHVALIDQLTLQLSQRQHNHTEHNQSHRSKQHTRDEIIACYSGFASLTYRRISIMAIRHCFSIWRRESIAHRSAAAYKSATASAHAALRSNCSTFFFQRVCARKTMLSAFMLWRVGSTEGNCKRTLRNRTVDVARFSRHIRIFKVKSNPQPPATS
jgi:hypothetical protein